MEESAVSLADVTFSYRGAGVPSLSSLSLDVAAGECVLLCGKSVSLQQINGASREEFVSALRPLFNNETWPLELAWESRPFGDVNELRAAIQVAVLTADDSRRAATKRQKATFSL